MPNPSSAIPNHNTHTDDDTEDQSQTHSNTTTTTPPTLLLTTAQKSAAKLRLYRAQRQGNWLALKNQLPLPNTINFDLDEQGNVDWIRRADGSKMWLMKLCEIKGVGQSRVWFILKDAYVEW